MKAIVTGGAGFIGSHVVDYLIEDGIDVVVLDDLSGGFKDNVNASAEFIEGSILDYELINSLFKKHKFDYVYHLAAYAAEGLSHFIKRFNYMNNAVGSVNMIDAAVNYKVKCFVFTSSIAVYGANQVPMTEDLLPIPEDPYGIAKLSIERDLQTTHEMFGLNYVIFRPHNVYGERQNLGDRYRNVIGIFMNKIMRGESLTVFGNGEQTRAFSYIGDVAPYIARCVSNEKIYQQIFNIGADIPYSVNTLASEVCRAMGKKVDVRHLAARNEVLHAYASHEKAQKLLKAKAQVDLTEGLRRMTAWAFKAGSRASHPFKNIEILQNLPPIWLED